MKLRDIPTRVSTGGYILHSGIQKWRGDEATAKGLHGMAAGAFPFLKDVPPERFLRMLAAGEIAVGSTLLIPFIPTGVAGGALTGFSGALTVLYARTPGLREPGSIWPSQQGIAVSKDVWLLGIGLGLVSEAVSTYRRHRRDALRALTAARRRPSLRERRLTAA